jgi:hypothetical protein
MFAALLAKLAELETLGGGLAVLGGRIIAVLALTALQGNDFAWHEKLLWCLPALPPALSTSKRGNQQAETRRRKLNISPGLKPRTSLAALTGRKAGAPTGTTE